MTEENKTPSGNDGQASGETSDQNSSTNQSADKKVAYETYQKILAEKKAATAKVKEHEDNLKRIEEDRLKKDGDWKGLIDARENEIINLRKSLEETSSRFDKLNSRVTNGEKLSSVLSQLGADVPSKYYGLIDIEDVAINPETGDIDAMTAKKVAERFKVEYPEVLKKSVHSGMMGAGHGNGVAGSGSIKHSDWMKLPYDKQKAFKNSQIID